MRIGPARAAGVLALAFVLVVVAVVGGYVWLRGRGLAGPVPGQQRCVATAGGASVTLDLDQARYASIVVGVAVRRGLPPRAATIAMATVYQETGIRNLGYGDRDSVGLFQQRPSQGWGSEEQLMDPHYAAGKFYDALVKIRDWQDRDITEVAQLVQRSAYPEAYRDHEGDARILASTLTGYSPAGFTCLEREGRRGRPAELVRVLERTFGELTTERAEQVVVVDADSATLAWAYGHFAVANSRAYGVTAVQVGDREWRNDPINLPGWGPAAEPPGRDQVRITLR